MIFDDLKIRNFKKNNFKNLKNIKNMKGLFKIKSCFRFRQILPWQFRLLYLKEYP